MILVFFFFIVWYLWEINIPGHCLWKLRVQCEGTGYTVKSVSTSLSMRVIGDRRVEFTRVMRSCRSLRVHIEFRVFSIVEISFPLLLNTYLPVRKVESLPIMTHRKMCDESSKEMTSVVVSVVVWKNKGESEGSEEWGWRVRSRVYLVDPNTETESEMSSSSVWFHFGMCLGLFTHKPETNLWRLGVLSTRFSYVGWVQTSLRRKLRSFLYVYKQLTHLFVIVSES